MALSELGIGSVIGIAAASISIASSFIVKASSSSIARQPFFAQKIISMMLLAQSIIEAPVIFAFIVALLIRSEIHNTMTMLDGVKNVAACLAIIFGCIGPSIGQAIFGHAACCSIGLNKKTYNKIFSFTLLNQAVIETPLIFCLLISLILIYTPLFDDQAIFQGSILLTSALTIGFGALGTATGLGYTASKSCYQIAYDPENYSLIFRMTLIIHAFIESSIIYAMIIALLLIMKGGS